LGGGDLEVLSHIHREKGTPMRRVLACIGIAAAACLAALPAANAEPTTGDDPALQQVAQPVINEVQTRGVSGAMDQFVEILNPSRTEAIDLSGWRLNIYAPNNVLLQTVFFPEGATLLPLGAGPTSEGVWTMSSQAFTGGTVDQPGVITVDIPANGGVALFNPGGVKADSVAFSSTITEAVEGQPLTPQPANVDVFNAAYGRNVVGQDTNNNLIDFKLLTRSPGELN
jgi:hypothetical protein